MFELFSRNFFFLVFLFSFLFLLTPSIQAQTSNPPSAPGKPTVTGGNQQVTLTASVSNNGGAAITGWEYQQKVDGGNYGSWTEISNSSSGNSLSGTVTGLQNGTTYRFKVRAQNNQHYSAESPESDAVTPATTPGAPGKPTVTGGNQQVTLAASVSDNGGSAVTGWEYQQKVDGGSYGSWTQISNSSSGNSLSGTVTGLQNGTTYRFKVRAVNGNGDGAESPESDAVTTAGPPAAPGKPTVTGGNQQVTLAASVSSNGGSAVTGWKYRQKTDGGSYGSWTQISNSSSGNSLSGTVTGLQNGTAYRFQVRAVNANGDGAESPESDAVTPAGPPAAPGKPTVTGGNQQVTLAASVSSNGGSAVTGWKYQQKVDGGSYGSWTQISNSSSGNSLSGTVTGLQNGTTYRFKVRAVNGNGDGAESPESDAVTPAACASSLTGVKASGAFVDYGYDREFTIKVSWDEVPNAAYTVIWENSRPQNLPYAGQFGPADKSYYEIDGNKIFYIIPGHKSNEGSVTYMISVTAIVDGCEDVSYGPVTVSTGGGE